MKMLPSVIVAVLVTSVLSACKAREDRSAGKGPANELLNEEARKRVVEVRAMMGRGENTTVRCAGARTYAQTLASDEHPSTVALVQEIKTLCGRDAPIAFARATLARMAPAGRGSAEDCAVVGIALEDIAPEHAGSAEARAISTSYEKLCKQDVSDGSAAHP